MHLEFSDEQETLREMVRNVCERHCSSAAVRDLEDDPLGYSADFWRALADTGVLGLMIAPEYGGSGMSMLDAVIVYEEFGRAIAPSPHFVSAVLGADVIAAGGTADQRSALLPAIADGSLIVTPAWLEPDGGYGPHGVRLAARRSGDGWILSGTKRHVTYALAAHKLLVLARTVDDDVDGIGLFLVDRETDGVTLSQQHSLASDAQYRVDFVDVPVSADALIGTADRGWAVFSAALTRAIVLLAAQAVGGAQRAHELGVDYAKVRHQFDKPLGAFQAIAHYLADRSAEIDAAQVLVWQAAWNHDQGLLLDKYAPMAKLFACETFRTATATTLQIFGGNGFTVDYDIQLYFRRAKQLELSFWDNRYLEELVAAAVFTEHDNTVLAS